MTLICDGTVVLHVTPSFVPSEESSVIIICEFAVTAEVFTTTLVVDAAMTKDPTTADPHTAGEAEEEQLFCVPKLLAKTIPPTNKAAA